MYKNIILSILCFIFIIILCILGFLVIENITKKEKENKCMEKIYLFSEENNENVFTINKIVYFSGVDGKSNINPNSSFTISNLLQYTDIAIFINNHPENGFEAKNTLKEISISKVNFEMKPSIGKTNLYFKNINDFATSKLNVENLIQNELNFLVSSEEQIDFDKPILYNNCANPITICYANSNLKEDYTLQNVSNISYDGTLLKQCNITLNSIACKISFVITIVNNLNEIYTCPIIINIPLSTEKSTLYDGYLLLNDNVDYKFIKKLN